MRINSSWSESRFSLGKIIHTHTDATDKVRFSLGRPLLCVSTIEEYATEVVFVWINATNKPTLLIGRTFDRRLGTFL